MTLLIPLSKLEALAFGDVELRRSGDTATLLVSFPELDMDGRRVPQSDLVLEIDGEMRGDLWVIDVEDLTFRITQGAKRLHPGEPGFDSTMMDLAAVVEALWEIEGEPEDKA